MRDFTQLKVALCSVRTGLLSAEGNAMNEHPLNLPRFWLRRPPYPFEEHQTEFERLERMGLTTGVVTDPDTVPVWAFLCWLCDRRGYVAHGTGHDNIAVFEPRQSNDVSGFGNRMAVYAASDGLWAMFFAVMNRPAVQMTVVNAAITVELSGDAQPLYFFGASRHAVEGRAYRHGWVYVLPARSFESEAGGHISGLRFTSHHRASLVAVRPAFRVAVSPEQFPFLARIHAYDDAELAAASQRNPDGFPWINDDQAEAAQPPDRS